MEREPNVGDVMRTEVPVVPPTATVATVANLMAQSGLPGIPVVDAGEIVGIVTEADLIARQADVDVPSVVPFLDAIFVADGGRDFEEELRHVLGTTAADLMTSPVFNILATANLTQLATLMVDEGINPVPVLNEDRSLVGIVSRADLVKVIARLEQSNGEPAVLAP